MLHQFPKHLYRLNQTIHFDFESLKKRKPNSLVSSFGWMHRCSSGTRAAMLVCGRRMKSLALLGGEWACASLSIAVCRTPAALWLTHGTKVMFSGAIA
jgi:hypothetical protein